MLNVLKNGTCKITIGQQYVNYCDALIQHSISSLTERWFALCKSFAKLMPQLLTKLHISCHLNVVIIIPQGTVRNPWMYVTRLNGNTLELELDELYQILGPIVLPIAY